MERELCKKLRRDILTRAEEKKLDPYHDQFRPKDLRLDTTKYGSFSDHCGENKTKSSYHCGCGMLRVVHKYRRIFFYKLNQVKR